MELIIVEKPKSALRIAMALADDKAVKRNYSGVPYYELSHGGKKIVVAAAVGHLFGLVERKESKGERKGERMQGKKKASYPVFNIEWQPKAGFTKKYAQVLKLLSAKADSFVIACDYDIEGEVIGFNVLRFIAKQLDARRMKYSTLTENELINSYENSLPNIDWGQALAGETRHYLDYYYGISLSRALMEAIQKVGRHQILSIGRVQGPALALLAKREREIQNFKPEPYWQIFLLVKNSHELEVQFPKNIFDKNEAEKFLLLKGKKGVAKTEKEVKEIQPPPPFDLTTLQVEAYKFLGLTPAQTLQLTQNLYLAGLISYPRTASQKLPPAIGYRNILNKLSESYPVSKYAKRSKPIEGKASDPAHPAIFPTGEKPENLSKIEQQLYDLIVRRFISCFAEDALVEYKVIRVNVDGKEFVVKGLQVRKKGWTEVYKVK
ncbi:MAG: DNA topoisomerase I, partial [Nanoarchaeota archaeon]